MINKSKSINVNYQLHHNYLVCFSQKILFKENNVESKNSLCWYDGIDCGMIGIGNLDEEVDESALRALFIPFGEVREVTLPLDAGTGQRRGFGFVEFDEPEDASEARENMNSGIYFNKFD